MATCSDCRFWRKMEPHHDYADCMRLPPQFELSVTVRRDRYERDDITVSRFPHARWPNTHRDDWCGEHRPKEEPGHG